MATYTTNLGLEKIDPGTKPYYDKEWANLDKIDSLVAKNDLTNVSDATILPRVRTAMFKTFYVDQTNGDDNNDGSSGSPFKTLNKACDSVPTGGFGIINLLSNITITSNIFINSKNIQIIASTDTTITATAYIKETGGTYYNACEGFKLINGNLSFSKIKLVVPSKANSSYGWAWNTGVITTGINFSLFNSISGVSFFGVGMTDNTVIYQPSDGCPAIITGSTDTAGSAFFQLSHASIKTDSSQLFSIVFSIGIMFFGAYNSILTDTSGNSKSWSDVISGIVKDSNGVPRNIVSNIIF